MKIYTKTGDSGSTGLIGGDRVSKSDPRIECYGTVDELNASIRLACAAADPSLQPKLRQVQNELFVIGSHLAAPNPSSAQSLPVMDASIITRL